MKKYFYTLVFMFIINVATIFSQSYQSSLIAEVAGLATNKKDVYSNNDNKELVSAFIVSYSGQIRLNSNYQLELRPGYLFSSIKNDHYYSKIQLGLFLRRKLIDSIFCVIGINSEINPIAEEASTSSSPKRLTFSIGGNVGLRLNKDFSILLSYYKTLDEDYGHGQTFETAYFKYLYWLLKLGVEFNL